MFDRNEPRNQRLPRRSGEGPRDPYEEKDRVDRHDVRDAVRRDRKEERGAHRERSVARGKDPGAIEPVSDVTRRKREGDPRHELNQPYVAEIQRAVGERVDLPAYRDADHLNGRVFDERRRDIEAKVAMNEGRTRSDIGAHR